MARFRMRTAPRSCLHTGQDWMERQSQHFRSSRAKQVAACSALRLAASSRPRPLLQVAADLDPSRRASLRAVEWRRFPQRSTLQVGLRSASPRTSVCRPWVLDSMRSRCRESEARSIRSDCFPAEVDADRQCSRR